MVIVEHKSAEMSSPLKMDLISSSVGFVIKLVYVGLWASTALMTSARLNRVMTNVHLDITCVGLWGIIPSHAGHGIEGRLKAR